MSDGFTFVVGASAAVVAVLVGTFVFVCGETAGHRDAYDCIRLHGKWEKSAVLAYECIPEEKR